MKPAAKIMIGLGAAAATVLWASRSRHRAAIRGTTLLMAGAARHLDWKAAREWIDRGARVVVYARSAREVESALRELRKLGPAAAVHVSKSEGEEPSSGSTAGVGSLLGAVAAVSSVAKWLWPAVSHVKSYRDDGRAHTVGVPAEESEESSINYHHG